MRFKYIHIFQKGLEPVSMPLDYDCYEPEGLTDLWSDCIVESLDMEREIWFSERSLR